MSSRVALRSLLLITVVMAALVAACTGDIRAPGEHPGEPGAGKGGGGSATVQRALGAPQVRLLSGPEYRATVRDLLGLEASPAIAHADHGGGYDTGVTSKLDENLFTLLFDEAERLAEAYVNTRIEADFSCFSKTNVTDECVGQIVDRLGRRAFRRPVSEDDRASLLALYAKIATDSGDPLLAAQSLITRLLASVKFLYRTELGAPKGKTRVLDPFESASLLSYAVTGSMPDDALLDDAEKGMLNEARLRHHVQRLMVTPAGRARFIDVMRQWLRVGDLSRMATEPAEYPKLQSPEQGAALADEFDAYVGDVVFEGPGTLAALLGSSHTFVNRHTAPLYGLQSASDAFTRVELEPTQRRGVLSLASVAAVHSSVADLGKDRPVIRGLLLKNQLLCEEVGLPSGIDTAAAAANVQLSGAEFDALTTREQFEKMMNQGQECKNCHQQFMPLGFLMGNLDALGRFRTHKGQKVIDTAVVGLPVGDGDASYADYVDFIDDLGSSDIVSRCFTKNLIAYAVGSAKGPQVDYLTAALGSGFNAGDIAQLFEDLLAHPDLYEREGSP